MTKEITERSRGRETEKSRQTALSSPSPPPPPSQFDSSQDPGPVVPFKKGCDSASPTRSSPSNPYQSLFPSLQELASQTFLSQYVRDDASVGHGHFDYLPSFCAESGIDDHLSISMSAVGLACFSTMCGSRETAEEAQRHYAAALRLIQTALYSPTDVRKDSTLLSVMLLGLFETITYRMDMKLKYWTAHTMGATALLELRGRQQFQSETSVRMFMQINSNIIVSCMHRGAWVSAGITQLRADVTQFIDAKEPAWIFSEIMVKFINFRAAIRDGSLTAPEDMIVAGLEVDLELLRLSESMPAQWRHETVVLDRPVAFVFGNHYHVYKDQWVAQICNSLRVARILLNELIEEQLRKLPSTQCSGQFHLSQDVIAQMASEICASVPQQARFLPMSDGGTANESGSPPAYPTATSVSWRTWQGRQTSFPFITLWTHFASLQYQNSIHSEDVQEQSPLNLDRSGAYFLVWPLFVAGAVDIASDRQRLWTIDCLQAIGGTARIWEATALAGTLKRRERFSVW